MSKTLVLAEKPSVGRDIARVLNCHKNGNGFFEGDRYIVTWALGHLVTLATPDEYDNKYQTWRLEDLPIMPDDLKTIVISKTRRQFNTVRTQTNRKDVKDIVIATDAGREGELVARWILSEVGTNKPLKRLWISSVTDKAIRDGFNQLKPGQQYENLYAAAVARSEADWYVGLNATRTLTTKFNAQLSAGRVQTPTLGIIASREEQIKTFKPRKYQTIQAKVKTGLTFTYRDQTNNERIFDENQTEKILQSINNKQLNIKSITKRERKSHAPQLYDLTELQQDANRLFNFSGKQTLNIMQGLYERHKVLTYPRTDSRVITTDIVPTLKERVEAASVDEYSALSKQINLTNIKLPRSVVNDQEVTDHHAIIPTEQPVYLADMSPEERRVYDLVVKRFFAVLSPAHVYNETTVIATVEQYEFYLKENVVKNFGWKAVYKEEVKETNPVVNTLKEGNNLTNVNYLASEGSTTPPARLTEGTLLKAMENPTRYMEDTTKELEKTIQQAGGLGTVATRADIIDKLYNTQYMEKRGKYLHLTKKGEQILKLAPEALRSPALTAEWEGKLKQIEAGKLSKKAFIKEIKLYTKEIIQHIKGMETTFKHDNITGTHCPKCNKFMLEIENRNGKMLRCQDRACNHKQNVYKNTNARCPNCKKRLKLYGEGDSQMFTCVCGHREKMETFQKRRKKHQKSRVSKQDINKYLKKEEEFTNNPFAEALKKLKDDQ
ncbi:MAG TPA: DNA topoisomerase 3 [Pseudogracilibacillus sp.]|nr:DNA topoisomerase 3 [Pseudogracilibacillus sp.]